MAFIGNIPTSATFAIDSFNGDNSTVNFTLREAPVTTSSILVFVGGIRQHTDTYSLSGTTLTFSEAPPTGTNNIQVLFLGLGASPHVPSDFSVSTVKIQSNAVTGDKIGLTAITSNLIASSVTLTTPVLGVATATSLQGIIGNVTPAAGSFTNVTATGIAVNGSTSGAVTLSAPAVAGTVTVTLPTTTGTMLTTASSSSSIPGNGNLTEADQWRLNANITNTTSATVLSTNWERSDSHGAGYVGTGMTESSGIFTFPITGTWLIQIMAYISVQGSQRYNNLAIQTTTNNSTYNTASQASQFIDVVNSNYTIGSLYAFFIFNVTNTTNCKVRFTQSCEGTAGVWGGATDENNTAVNFIRLGA